MKTEQNFKIMPINQYTKKHPSNKQEHIKSKQEYFIKIWLNHMKIYSTWIHLAYNAFLP